LTVRKSKGRSWTGTIYRPDAIRGGYHRILWRPLENRGIFQRAETDIGSADMQTKNPVAVTNHLDFCMMATAITWIYACRLEKTPNRRHAVHGRMHFAFSDIRRSIAMVALSDDFEILFLPLGKPSYNSVVAACCGWQREPFGGNFSYASFSVIKNR